MKHEVFCSCCGWDIVSDPIWTNGGPVCAECWDYCRGGDECRLARLPPERLPFEPEGPGCGPWRVGEWPKHE